MSDVLEPDDDAIHAFLTRWFAGCNRGMVELGWTDERDGKLNLFQRFELDDLVAAARFAAETNARPGCSVYFRPATVRADSKYTRDADVLQVGGIWIDCDTEDAVNRVLAAADLAPWMQIITGRIPNLRSQFLWKFSGPPILVPDPIRDLNRRLQVLAGGDPAVINVSTLLRLPGSIAWPWKPGRQAELTAWCIPAGGGHTVTVDTLRHRLPPLADAGQKPNGASHGAEATSTLRNPVQALLDAIRTGPGWHDPVLRLVAVLVARGVPSAVIMAMAEHLTRPGYTTTQTRDELVVMIDGARGKGFGPSDADDVMDVPAKAASHFPSLTEIELAALPEPEWLIADILAANSLCVLYGPYSSFKSFVVLHAALCLVTGRPFYDRAVKPVHVLYIAGEGVSGLKLRIAAWKQHHGISEPIEGFRVVPLAVNLMDKVEVDRLIQTVKALADFTPALIVIDTLHRCTPGADENSAREMGLAIRHCALIQQRLGCALMPVHHAGKDSERGMRGSSGVPGAADTIIRVSRTGDIATLTTEKQKDAEADLEIHLRAQRVDLPLAAGSVKPRTSLVLVPADGEPPDRVLRRLSKLEAKARRFLFDLLVAEGKPVPSTEGFPSPVGGEAMRCVPIERWAEECETRQLSTAEARRNRAMIFRRTFQSLLDKDVVAVRDGLVWPAR